MSVYYFSIGTSLANQVNMETLFTFPPVVLEGNRIPLLGPVQRVTGSGAVQRNGSISAPVVIDWCLWTELDSFIQAYWSDYSTASASLYATWLSEDGFYYPYNVQLERPYEGSHYQLVDSQNVRHLTIPGRKWRLQSNTENSTTTLTTSERYVEGDTTSGAVDWTLPAASAVNANTLFSGVKTGGGNTLRYLPDGTDTIDGGASLTITTRKDIISDGVSAWVSI